MCFTMQLAMFLLLDPVSNLEQKVFPLRLNLIGMLLRPRSPRPKCNENIEKLGTGLPKLKMFSQSSEFECLNHSLGKPFNDKFANLNMFDIINNYP